MTEYKLKSAHSCRICGHWTEGDANRATTDEAREAAQALMARGYCDDSECAKAARIIVERTQPIMNRSFAVDGWEQTEGSLHEDLRVFVAHDDASRVMDEPWVSLIEAYRKAQRELL
jgi:hypothetical protein